MASSFASGDATHVSFVLQARVRLAEGGMSEELNYIFFFVASSCLFCCQDCVLLGV